MISSVSSMSSMQGMQMRPPRMEDAELTDEQMTKLQEIISKYDPENMTEEDTKSMMDELRTAGIKPGEDMKTALEEAGFDLKPPEGMKPPDGPPPDGMQGASGQQSQYISDFLAQYQAGNVTNEDILSFLDTLSAQGESATGLIINQNS